MVLQDSTSAMCACLADAGNTIIQIIDTDYVRIYIYAPPNMDTTLHPLPSKTTPAITGAQHTPLIPECHHGHIV